MTTPPKMRLDKIMVMPEEPRPDEVELTLELAKGGRILDSISAATLTPKVAAEILRTAADEIDPPLSMARAAEGMIRTVSPGAMRPDTQGEDR